MPTLIDNPSFAANEIYQIQATDSVEGAAIGASFGGLGLSNQPHQQLANRTALLKQRQDTNIAKIAAIQAFVAGFTGSLGQSGYLKIPLVDLSRGSISAVVQWGSFSLSDAKIGHDQQFAVSWPIAFPNAVFVAVATNVYRRTHGQSTVASIVTGTLSTTGARFVLDVPDGAGTASPEESDGFTWIAIGF